MLEGIAISLKDFGLAGLVSIFFLLMFTGRIKPKSDFDRMERDNNRLRDANEKLVTVVGELTKQTEELLVQARTTNALLSALPRAREDDT